MNKTISSMLLVILSAALYAAPIPFRLSRELTVRAPKALRTELKKSAPGTAAYTLTAMKVMEERIKLRMRLLKFDLNTNEALSGMESSDSYKVQSQRLSITPAQRKKIFTRYRDKIKLLTRYNKSFRIRNEVIGLFRQCTPALPENRFHSEFLSMLEFQHIYLEKQIQNLRNTLR